jgi:hypothetical protein
MATTLSEEGLHRLHEAMATRVPAANCLAW